MRTINLDYNYTGMKLIRTFFFWGGGSVWGIKVETLLISVQVNLQTKFTTKERSLINLTA